jgi:hypothetical protein
MYRIYHRPTKKLIAIETEWRRAAAILRGHAAAHNDEVYNAVTADPSVILHLASMGGDAYRIDRDEMDILACSNCDELGAVTGTGSIIGYTGWVSACCADCANAAERSGSHMEGDYTSHQIRAAIDRALAAPTTTS